MKKRPAREIIAERLATLVGPGLQFNSAPELAQRALTLGLIANKESFVRTINRIRNAELDPQINTIETIAEAADVELTWLLGMDDTTVVPVLREAAAAIRAGGERAETIIRTLEALVSVTGKSNGGKSGKASGAK